MPNIKSSAVFSVRNLLALVICLTVLALAGCSEPEKPAPPPPAPVEKTPAKPVEPAPPPTTPEVPKKETGKKLIATVETTKGTIQFELLTDDAPKSTENFRLLANKGFYNGIIFHRTISGFMIQGGDPTGTGAGGQSAFGHDFEDEINRTSPVYQAGYQRGIVAMANRGPNTNGSQFFIMHQNYALPPNYTIFGRVLKGQEVVDAIATAPTQGDRPVSPVKIKSAKVEEAK